MKNGGKVIGSGGFGCIFRPQIKCNASYKTYGENKYDGCKPRWEASLLTASIKLMQKRSRCSKYSLPSIKLIFSSLLE